MSENQKVRRTSFFAKEKSAEEFQEVESTYTSDVNWLMLDPSSVTSKERSLVVKLIGYMPDSRYSIVRTQSYSTTIDGSLQTIYLAPSNFTQSKEFRERNKLSTRISYLFKEREKGNDVAIALVGDKNDRGKKGALNFSSKSYIIVQVIRDLQVPENTGKYFAMSLNEELEEKIKNALNPSENDIADGAKPVDIWNPLYSWNLKLVCGIGTKTYTNKEGKTVNSRSFGKSEWIKTFTPILIGGKLPEVTDADLIGGEELTPLQDTAISEWEKNCEPMFNALMFSEEKYKWDVMEKYVLWIDMILKGVISVNDMGRPYDLLGINTPNTASSASNAQSGSVTQTSAQSTPNATKTSSTSDEEAARKRKVASMMEDLDE